MMIQVRGDTAISLITRDVSKKLVEVKGDFLISSGGKALTDCESSDCGILLFANYVENIQTALHSRFICLL